MQFTSSTFERYLLGLGIRHALMAPFHSASKGQAEHMVQSAKEALARLEKGDWYEHVTEYFLMQHITPDTSTGHSLAELLMGHHLTSPLDQLHLDFIVTDPQGCADTPQSFFVGDQVFTRNCAGEVLWVPAIVAVVSGPALTRWHLMMAICSESTLIS